MWRVVLTFLLYFQNGRAILWPKGVVHFAINAKDYDMHSQDIIQLTLEDIEHEICVKFFNVPSEFNSSARVLYINNPGKRKACPPDKYNFTGPIVDMPIGYECLNKKNIARIVVDMLRASIEDTEPALNSYDLIRKFQEQQEDPTRNFLINPTDRNFINANYHGECRSPPARAPPAPQRRSGAVALSADNLQYYRDGAWPLGVVMYGVQEDIVNSAPHVRLKNAMTSIELASCVVFQEVKPDYTLKPNNLLWFAKEGADAPSLGFKEGNQTVSLTDMVTGAPGHLSHALNQLMRALGVPMVSNRPDRDNHVNIHWNNVEKGKERYLEQYPMAGWVRDAQLPYDFQSVTHAPANYACRGCRRGEATVEPAHDNLWMRALSMGHYTELSNGDRLMLEVVYKDPCRNRYANNNK